MHRGHYNGDAHIAHIALNGRAPLPDRMIIAHAVQKIQRRIGSAVHRAFHPDLPFGLLWKNHIHIHTHPQHIGKIVYMKQRHLSFPLKIKIFFRIVETNILH